MSRLQLNTPVDHRTDADFRTWGLEFSNALSSIGLTQTADTGQVNWATVTRPAAAGDGGYEIWRFNDSVQLSAPIFLKFIYGTRATSAPRIGVQIGTGSDGSGNLTGPTTAVKYINGAFTCSATTATTNYLSNFFYGSGCLAIVWKIGVSSNTGFFCISRSCDSSGDPTDIGWCMLTYGTQTSATSILHNSYNFNSNLFTTEQSSGQAITHYVHLPSSVSSSFVGSDAQVYLGFSRFPRVQPFIGCVAVKTSEFGADSTFTCQPVGSTSREYLNLGAFAASEAFVSAAGHNLAILWEA